MSGRHRAGPPVLEGPHARACGLQIHPHGVNCAADCPTCSAQPSVCNAEITTGGVLAYPIEVHGVSMMSVAEPGTVQTCEATGAHSKHVATIRSDDGAPLIRLTWR